MKKLLPLAVLTLILLISCVQPPTEVTEPPAAPTEAESTAMPEPSGPKSGGVLRTTFQTEDASTLDPVVPLDNAAIFTILQIYDQFFRVGLDSQIEFDAVESYEVSDDGLVYTFKVRPGLTFSDGSPVTMDDVLFSVERFQASESWGYLLPEGLTVEALDDETLQMTLTAPNAALISSLATAAASIVPKSLVESAGEDYWEQPVGSGPFKVKEWARGERLTLERNEFYWDQPKPYLDEVVIELVPDDNTRMLKFTANEVDIALNVPYTQIESIDEVDGASVQVVPILASQNVHLNAGAPPLDDLNVRKALQHATDRQALIDAVLFGNGEIATMLWPKGLLYWDETVEGYPYDLDMARDFLSQSASPDGFDLTLYYATGDTPAEQTAALLQDQWAEIGVNLMVEPLEGTLQIDETLGGNFETSIVYWSSDIIDPSQLNISHLCALTEAMVGSCNEDFDAAAAAADTIVDQGQRAAAYADLFRIAEDWSIYIPLYYFPSRTAVWDYVKDFQLTPTVFPRYWEVWLDK